MNLVHNIFSTFFLYFAILAIVIVALYTLALHLLGKRLFTKYPEWESPEGTCFERQPLPTGPHEEKQYLWVSVNTPTKWSIPGNEAGPNKKLLRTLQHFLNHLPTHVEKAWREILTAILQKAPAPKDEEIVQDFLTGKLQEIDVLDIESITIENARIHILARPLGSPQLETLYSFTNKGVFLGQITKPRH